MNKNEVNKLIRAKSERVSLVKNDGQSNVWQSFLKVNIDGTYSHFVMCTDCHGAIKWNSKDGTSGLKAHMASCSKSTPQPTITTLLGRGSGQVNPAESKKRNVSADEKSKLTDLIVNMCGTDIRPFCIVEGVGFHTVATKLIEIGSAYGSIDSSDVLPSGRTVSRHLRDVAERERELLRSQIIGITRFAVTTDMWTHTQTSSQYITVTLHYVNNEFKLESRILGTRNLEERTTATNIKAIVKSILEEYGAYRTDNAYVTDNGANVKAAFKEDIWLPCCGHNLNLAVMHCLKNDEDGVLFDVLSNINMCKQLVTYVKRSKVHGMLETTLKQEVSTRWNSTLAMLQSVMINITELRRISGMNSLEPYN